jgi:hypothetical protein
MFTDEKALHESICRTNLILSVIELKKALNVHKEPAALC